MLHSGRDPYHRGVCWLCPAQEYSAQIALSSWVDFLEDRLRSISYYDVGGQYESASEQEPSYVLGETLICRWFKALSNGLTSVALV